MVIRRIGVWYLVKSDFPTGDQRFWIFRNQEF
jgi:hypothetical protein